jgi:hypothetical protein
MQVLTDEFPISDTGDIRTTGDLRAFLVNLMVQVKTGFMPVDRASQITKIAAQVNESFYSEIKISRIHHENGVQTTKLGQLMIGQDATNR